MGVGTIASALAFICAWSQPHCQALEQVGQQNIILAPIPSGPNGAPYGQTWWSRASRQPLRVVVNSALDDDPYIGTVLAHEAQEVLEGYPPNGRDCGDYDGYASGHAFIEWFVGAFGPPHPVINSANWFTLMTAVLRTTGDPC